MSAMRKDIWRDLMEKRMALIRALDAAYSSPLRDFPEADRGEWNDIDAALSYKPQPQGAQP